MFTDLDLGGYRIELRDLDEAGRERTMEIAPRLLLRTNVDKQCESAIVTRDEAEVAESHFHSGLRYHLTLALLGNDQSSMASIVEPADGFSVLDDIALDFRPASEVAIPIAILQAALAVASGDVRRN